MNPSFQNLHENYLGTNYPQNMQSSSLNRGYHQPQGIPTPIPYPKYGDRSLQGRERDRSPPGRMRDRSPNRREHEMSVSGWQSYGRNLNYTENDRRNMFHDYDHRNPGYSRSNEGNPTFERGNSPNCGRNFTSRHPDYGRETRDRTFDYERYIETKTPYERNFNNRSPNNEIDIKENYKYDRSYQPNPNYYRDREERQGSNFDREFRGKSPPPKRSARERNPSPYYSRYSENYEDPWDRYDPGEYSQDNDEWRKSERILPKSYNNLQQKSRSEMRASTSFQEQEIYNRSLDKDYNEMKNNSDPYKCSRQPKLNNFQNNKQVEAGFYQGDSRCGFDIREEMDEIKSGRRNFLPQSEVNFTEDNYNISSMPQMTMSSVHFVNVNPIHASPVENTQEFNDPGSSCLDEVDMEESESEEEEDLPTVDDKVFKTNLTLAFFPSKADERLERSDAKAMHDMMLQLIEDKANSYAQGNKEQQLRFVSPGKLWSHSYKIFCADQETFDWMLNWNPPIYNGMVLRPRRTLKEIQRIGIFLHGVYKKVDVSATLQQLSAQNKNLNTSVWSCLLNKYDAKGRGVYLIFDIDGESHRVIEQMDHTLYYQLSTVKVRTLQKRHTKYKNKKKKKKDKFVQKKKK